MNLLLNAARNYLRNSAGNVAIMFAFALIPLLAAGGAGIDYARYVAARNDLQVTLDAATLAGTHTYADSGGNAAAALTVARKYYDAQIQVANYQLITNDITFEINKTKNGVFAHGTADMKTSFMSILGITSLPLLNNGTAEASKAVTGGDGTNVEVSLMLDVTGSMCDDGNGPCKTGTKISGAKTAANALVDQIFPNGQSGTTARVAIVPFNTMVRVEQDGKAGPVMKAMTNLNPTWSGFYQTCTASTGSWSAPNSESNGSGNWTCTATANLPANNWKLRPCVTDRYFDASSKFDISDSAPGAGNWLNATSGSRHPLSGDSSDTPLSWGTGATATDPIGAWDYTTDGGCYETDNSNTIVPLTNNTGTLKSTINGLTAYSGTAGVLGTAFSWYTISPNWASVWPTASKPAPYSDLTAKNAGGQVMLRKFAVLMTDGAYNSYRSWKGQDMNMVSANAKSMCTAMKAKGIEIYTVGFDFASLTSAESAVAQDTLSNCATDASHFYNSQSVADLSSAFAKIGLQIAATQSRLTK